MAATTANVAWPIQANSPSIPSFRKSLVPKNDFNVYKSLITQDKGSYINRMTRMGVEFWKKIFHKLEKVVFDT